MGLKVSPLSGEVLLERQDWIVLHVDCSITTLRGLQQVGTPAAHKETWRRNGGNSSVKKTRASRTVAKYIGVLQNGVVFFMDLLFYTLIITVKHRKSRLKIPLETMEVLKTCHWFIP